MLNRLTNSDALHSFIKVIAVVVMLLVIVSIVS